MSLPKVREDLCTVVLLGKFNPAIFQPAWLAAKGLIRESESTEAQIEIVHPDVAQFRAAWLHLSVTRDRFSASTTDQASYAPLRDLVVGIFQLLEQTPCTHLGLNRAVQVDMVNEAQWHALGHLVAPKAPWAQILETPGLRTLTMEGRRQDGLPGKYYVRVEPSAKRPYGAHIEVTSEYIVPGTGDATAHFVERLQKDWETAMADAEQKVKLLLERAAQGNE
jgi:hypothetical protein